MKLKCIDVYISIILFTKQMPLATSMCGSNITINAPTHTHAPTHINAPTHTHAIVRPGLAVGFGNATPPKSVP